ncbi:MAG: hypothetical protein JJU33_10155 [Phycisphaerales bacterium]|nr:hypothetical protein [Phycisphaerales bacterium]
MMQQSLSGSPQQIVVEGSFDQTAITCYLKKRNINSVGIWMADSIDVPNSVITGHGLNEKSNRSKVIAIAMEFANHKIRPGNFMCIADLDHESIGGPAINLPHGLRYTDVASMETYCFSESAIDGVLSAIAQSAPFSGKEFLDAYVGDMTKLQIFRASLQRLDARVAFPSLESIVRDRGSTLCQIDTTACAHMISKTLDAEQKEEFDSHVQTLTENVPASISHCRGRDLTHLLLRNCKRHCKPTGFRNTAMFQRALLMQSADELGRYSLFSAIEGLMKRA